MSSVGVEDLQESAQLDGLDDGGSADWSDVSDSLDLVSELEWNSASLLEHVLLDFAFEPRKKFFRDLGPR